VTHNDKDFEASLFSASTSTRLTSSPSSAIIYIFKHSRVCDYLVIMIQVYIQTRSWISKVSKVVLSLFASWTMNFMQAHLNFPLLKTSSEVFIILCLTDLLFFSSYLKTISLLIISSVYREYCCQHTLFLKEFRLCNEHFWIIDHFLLDMFNQQRLQELGPSNVSSRCAKFILMNLPPTARQLSVSRLGRRVHSHESPTESLVGQVHIHLKRGVHSHKHPIQTDNRASLVSGAEFILMNLPPRARLANYTFALSAKFTLINIPPRARQLSVSRLGHEFIIMNIPLRSCSPLTLYLRQGFHFHESPILNSGLERVHLHELLSRLTS